MHRNYYGKNAISIDVPPKKKNHQQESTNEYVYVGWVERSRFTQPTLNYNKWNPTRIVGLRSASPNLLLIIRSATQLALLGYATLREAASRLTLHPTYS